MFKDGKKEGNKKQEKVKIIGKQERGSAKRTDSHETDRFLSLQVSSELNTKKIFYTCRPKVVTLKQEKHAHSSWAHTMGAYAGICLGTMALQIYLPCSLFLPFVLFFLSRFVDICHMRVSIIIEKQLRVFLLQLFPILAESASHDEFFSHLLGLKEQAAKLEYKTFSYNLSSV